MVAKTAEAAVLLVRHCLLFSAIVLTVWLPANLLINYLIFHVYSEDNVAGPIRLIMWVDALLSPLVSGAVIASLSRIKLGRPVSYAEVMGVGLRKWGPLFWARFVAGILVILGFLALIVPGIVLSVRYALLDPVVVAEGADPNESRRRSTALTAGVRWEILAVAVLFFTAYAMLSFVAYLPLELLPILDRMSINVFIDCCLEIAYLPIQVLMFLYYWEAAHRHEPVAAAPAPGAA